MSKLPRQLNRIDEQRILWNVLPKCFNTLVLVLGLISICLDRQELISCPVMKKRETLHWTKAVLMNNRLGKASGTKAKHWCDKVQRVLASFQNLSLEFPTLSSDIKHTKLWCQTTYLANPCTIWWFYRRANLKEPLTVKKGSQGHTLIPLEGVDLQSYRLIKFVAHRCGTNKLRQRSSRSRQPWAPVWLPFSALGNFGPQLHEHLSQLVLPIPISPGTPKLIILWCFHQHSACSWQ